MSVGDERASNLAEDLVHFVDNQMTCDDNVLEAKLLKVNFSKGIFPTVARPGVQGCPKG